MAGHSHWAGIKHKKAAIDNKRGKLWSKLSKAIIIAAKTGGGDPVTNIRLRQAIQDAKDVSMPKDNISRAIKKGTGELDGGNVEEIIYEGYGAHGVAIMCDIMTDNRNRTAPELRKMFEIHGGNMGATNCVAWLFDRKGLFLVPVEGSDEETVMETALEAGADDFQAQSQHYEIICEPELYTAVAEALAAAEITVTSKQVTRIPNNTVDLDVEQARKVLKLMEALDDHDDVQNVSVNFSLSDEVVAELQNDA
ncbi:MAG: YebC/PmpR family DNA-binding transcriptional regulator [Planctomycetaceae bacterium]|mgnify:CR=1 FL=1|nr:YebC/PmpR family DNA-binding transcriptional regulator [Planctomycetaceae bacterium]|tara:strand:+ start:49 stop:804 length:756 start_codon:yes stop_codon:yes gene_type:complete